jgi:hypothetical protein
MEAKKPNQKITRTFLKELREQINRKLKSVAEEHEIEINCGNCSYGNNEATFKLKINIKNEDGKVMTAEYENLLNLADLKGFDINGIYTLNGRKVSLEGYNYRAKKYPLQVMDLENGDRRKVSKQWFDTNVANKVWKAMIKGAEAK